jgi:hypothetical protein
MKVIGIDKDNISEKEVRKLKKKIEDEQHCQVILYKTKNGYHLELIFNNDMSLREAFAKREEYGDCSERIRISKLNSRISTHATDILFSMKNSYLRKRLW